MSDTRAHRRREQSHAYSLDRRAGLPSIVKERRIDLDGDSSSSARARRRIEEAFRGLVNEAERNDLQLAVTELVNNAVEHGLADSEHHVILHVAVAPERIRAEVCDGGPGFNPAALVVQSHQQRGFGFRILDSLASRWGVATDDGTCVWFELDP